VGGRQVRESSGGYYIEPTIFDGVANDMTIAREEIFGPVLATLSFKDTDEAVKIANDSIYGFAGLSCGPMIWSKALKVSRALRAGTVNVNNVDGGGSEVPFGGYKQSGFGPTSRCTRSTNTRS